MVVGIYRSRSIADEQGLDSQCGEDTHGIGDLLHGISFVVMETALHGQYRLSAKESDDEVAFVPYSGGGHEMRYLGIGNHQCLGNAVGQFAKSAPQDDGRLKHGQTCRFDSLSQKSRCLCIFLIVHFSSFQFPAVSRRLVRSLRSPRNGAVPPPRRQDGKRQRCCLSGVLTSLLLLSLSPPARSLPS